MSTQMRFRRSGEVKVDVQGSSIKVGHFKRGSATIARFLEYGLRGRPTKPYLRLAAHRLRRGRIRTDDTEQVSRLAVDETRKAMDDLGIAGTGRLREDVEAR